MDRRFVSLADRLAHERRLAHLDLLASVLCAAGLLAAVAWALFRV